jgi:hypothetical protein
MQPLRAACVAAIMGVKVTATEGVADRLQVLC